MPLRKTREQREAQRAEIDRQDREHATRLAAVSTQARPPLFCQQCEAKLKPDATGCQYCGSHDLGTSQLSCPRFSEVAVGGACPRCHGTSFSAPDVTGTLAIGGFLASGAVGAAVGAMAGAMSTSDIILCVTWRNDQELWTACPD
jgi:ribosomal protein L40E